MTDRRLDPARLATGADPEESAEMDHAMLTRLGLSAALLATAAPATANPLLAPWAGPHGGAPPFDSVRVEQFAPALEAAMAAKLIEIEAIAADPTPPSFDNVVLALERAGRQLDRVQAVFSVYAGTLSSSELQAVEREFAPRMAALDDAIFQNARLFARLEAVYEARDSAGLDAEQQRLAWFHHDRFVRAGARLAPEAKARLAAINQRLASLFATFRQNVLADETDYVLDLAPDDVAGLPESVLAGAAAVASERGRKAAHAVANTRSSVEPFLAWSTRRDLREKVWRTYYSRADNGDSHDNNGVIADILALRHERALLLGFDTHAHWRLGNTMAGTPERAMELMDAVWAPAVARVREEVADMQAIADREADAAGTPRFRIEPWDYRFYAEKVRSERYAFDADSVRPYMQLDLLREGMFHVAGELFGLGFVEVRDLPVAHPDIRVWKVVDLRTGGQRQVGLWYFDPFARPGKRSGAWMATYRRQERLDAEVTTIVSNNSNFVKGKPGEPVLISWDDAETLFHEFGHAVHGLLSNVSYPSLAGTAVPRDYVEFPSQLLENWLSTPEVLDRFARHATTGAAIPRDLVERLERASTFNQGFATVEYLASALVDMQLHLAAGKPIDPDAFERQALERIGMPGEIVMRHRLPHFSHLFSSDSYSAGYYSYLWADTLTADAWEAFGEAGGPWDREVASRLRDRVLSVGNTVDAADGYRAFRGRDAGIGALLRSRGFPVPAPTGTATGPSAAGR